MSAALASPRVFVAASPWRRHLAALALVAAALLALFHRDALHIVSIWWESSTFNHCMLIVPLIGWLVWQRLPQLRELTPVAWAPGLLLVAAGAFGWLLGVAGGVSFARHASLVVMLEGAVIAILGRNVARGLAFPLFYALFLIPAGEALIPAMQTFTARVATALLGLSGIPAHLEGVFITTPAGYFEVAEACAGAKFLIAMVALGALVANLCFKSWPRRIAFMAAAIVVPVLANGVRAWGTIFVAERVDATFASSFDHVVYGGIFFALVIALILGAGWRFFDRRIDVPWFDPAAMRPFRGAPLGRIAAATLVLAALPLAWSGVIAARGTAPVPATLVFPDVPGWTRIAPGRDWRPHYTGADLAGIARYRDAEGRIVDLALIVYARQSEGRELVGYGQGATAPEGKGGWAWSADAPAPPDGRAERIASHGLEREVLTFYRVGTIVTGSRIGVKLATLKTRLLGGPQRAVALLVSAPASGAGLSARPAIDAFLAALGPIAPVADRAAGAV